MALKSLTVYTTSTPLNQKALLRFEPWATGHNSGTTDSIGLLKGQSEMTLNGMSSDQNNTV